MIVPVLDPFETCDPFLNLDLSPVVQLSRQWTFGAIQTVDLQAGAAIYRSSNQISSNLTAANTWIRHPRCRIGRLALVKPLDASGLVYRTQERKNYIFRNWVVRI